MVNETKYKSIMLTDDNMKWLSATHPNCDHPTIWWYNIMLTDDNMKWLNATNPNCDHPTIRWYN